MKKSNVYLAFKRLYKDSKLPWLAFIVSLITTVAITFIKLQLPMFAQQIMQGVIFEKNIVTNYILLTALISVLTLIEIIFKAKMDGSIVQIVRNKIWRKIMNVPLQYYDEEKPSTLISRISSDTTQSGVPFEQSIIIIDSLFSLIGSLAMMYSMSKELTLTLLPLIPWMIFVSYILGKLQYKANYNVKKKFSSFTSQMSERLMNIRLIKASSTQQEEKEHGFNVIDDQYKAIVYQGIISSLEGPLMMTVDALVRIIVLLFGAKMVLSKGLMDVSGIMAFYMYTQMLIPALIPLMQAYNTLKIAHGAIDKISELTILDEEQLHLNKEVVVDDIVLNDVSFSYSDKKIIDNISLHFEKNKQTALVGLSGSGKTTILKLLLGLYTPQEGQITIGDINLSECNLYSYRQNISYVSQNAHLLSGTILENITYGISKEVSMDEIIKACKVADCYDFIMALPQQFNTQVGEYGRLLSGGQRQRISIARAFIKNSDIILLDEAMCNLDCNSKIIINKALDQLKHNKTVIIISHQLETIQDVDRIYMLHNGKIHGQGTHDELSKNNELYGQFCQPLRENLC